jgi:hypothetical protein
MVSGYGGLLYEVTPGLEVFAGFKHHAIADMTLAALRLWRHASHHKSHCPHIDASHSIRALIASSLFR